MDNSDRYFFMDAETIRIMLNEIRETNYLGPKSGQYPIGDRVTYALDKGLIVRTDNGNLQLSEKGAAFLDDILTWEIL
jgi:hypothetical protein